MRGCMRARHESGSETNSPTSIARMSGFFWMSREWAPPRSCNAGAPTASERHKATRRR